MSLKMEASKRNFFKSPIFFIPLLAGSSIALFVPEDAISDDSFLNSYVKFVSSVFPAARAFMCTSSFPGVTGLYFSLMVPVGIFWFYWTTFVSRHIFVKETSLVARSITLRWRSRFVVSLFSIIFLTGCFFLFFLNPGNGIGFIDINRSRLSLGLWGGLLSSMPFLLLSCSIQILKMLIARKV